MLDKYKQAKLRHGETEIRFEQDPFPLYPGERLGGLVQPLVVVAENTALRLRAGAYSACGLASPTESSFSNVLTGGGRPLKRLCSVRL